MRGQPTLGGRGGRYEAWAMPVVAPVADIYDVQQRAVLVLADAIQVKGQPAQRPRPSSETGAIKVLALNHAWEQTWFPEQVAA